MPERGQQRSGCRAAMEANWQTDSHLTFGGGRRCLRAAEPARTVEDPMDKSEEHDTASSPSAVVALAPSIKCPPHRPPHVSWSWAGRCMNVS